MNELMNNLAFIWFWWLLGIVIKHFLDRGKEKIFFEKNLKKEIYFNLKNKTFELLILIDKLEDKSIFLKKDLWENTLLEIKTYRKNKNNIINLIRVYLHDFDLNTFIITDNNIEKFLLIYSNILINWENNNNDFKHNHKIITHIGKLQKENEIFISDLKKEISNYLIEIERKLFK